MLCKKNSGKYLDEDWHEKRGKAMVDRILYDSDTLDFLEITGADGTGRDDSKTYTISTGSMEGKVTENHFDIRKLPKMGGVDDG